MQRNRCPRLLRNHVTLHQKWVLRVFWVRLLHTWEYRMPTRTNFFFSSPISPFIYRVEIVSSFVLLFTQCSGNFGEIGVWIHVFNVFLLDTIPSDLCIHVKAKCTQIWGFSSTALLCGRVSMETFAPNWDISALFSLLFYLIWYTHSLSLSLYLSISLSGFVQYFTLTVMLLTKLYIV